MYYINDLTKKKSILRIKSSQDAKTFLTWAKEYSPSYDIVISDNYISVIESELSLEYFGFSVESFCTLLIT